MSRLVVLVAVVCLLWQAMAFAGARVTLLDHHEDQHEMLHFSKAGHHHDDDHADVHRDDAPESTAHVTSDGAVYPVVVACGGMQAVDAKATSRPVPIVPHCLGCAHVGGIERPPRLAA